MKKLFTLLLFACLFSTQTNAQLPNGSIAPSWTLTDIEGNEWNLYSILAEGKSVVIDFSATWCGPCWGYHTTHALKDLYEMYGPDGTDEMMVFFIEGDFSTGMDDLLGETQATQGNWIEDTPYPIIDNHTMNGPYQLSAYPTIYHICPSGTIKKMGQTSAANLYAQNSQCSDPIGNENLRVLECDLFDGIFCGEVETTPTAFIQNNGVGTLTTAELTLHINGELDQTLNWEGNLETYQSETVTFEPITVDEDATIEIVISSVNGGDDDPTESQYNEVSASITEANSTTTTTVNFTLVTDNYGLDTYWQITDEAGDIIASGGNELVAETGGGSRTATENDPGAYGNNQTIEEEITLPADGCYEFLILDDWGDGICCSQGEGSFILTDADGEEILSGASFGISRLRPFSKENSMVNTNDVAFVNELSISPNPVTGNTVDLAFTLQNTTDITIEVYNAFGQKIKLTPNTTFTQGSNSFSLNTSTYANGIYFVTLSTAGQEVIAQRFVVSK